MDLHSVIQADVKRLGIVDYAISERLIPFADLRLVSFGGSGTALKFINFNPQELIYPYGFIINRSGTNYIGSVSIEFYLKSACNFTYIKRTLYINGVSTALSCGEFEHISMHREYLCMDWVHDPNFKYNTSYIKVAVLKILNKNTANNENLLSINKNTTQNDTAN